MWETKQRIGADFFNKLNWAIIINKGAYVMTLTG